MVYCSVPYCKSRQVKGNGLSFHKFPLNSDVRRQWLLAVSREGDKSNRPDQSNDCPQLESNPPRAHPCAAKHISDFQKLF